MVGLRGAELAAACGVPDAVFVHLGRFVGAARSREGALAMARQIKDNPKGFRDEADANAPPGRRVS